MESNSKVEATLEIIRKRLRGEEKMEMKIGSVEHFIETMKEACHRYNSNAYSTMISVMLGNLDFLTMTNEGKDIRYTPDDLKRLFDAMREIVLGTAKED